jgi:hypothetical protein
MCGRQQDGSYGPWAFLEYRMLMGAFWYLGRAACNSGTVNLLHFTKPSAAVSILPWDLCQRASELGAVSYSTRKFSL